MKPIKHFISKSLFGTGILAVLLLAFSCTEDTSSEELKGTETLKAVEAKAEATRPIKGRLDFIFDYSNDINRLECVPGVFLYKTIVSGNMSNLGNLKPGNEFDEGANEPISGSWFIPITCTPTGPFTIDTEYRSVYVAANGDELHATEEVSLTFTGDRVGFFVGRGTINGDLSTGRFKYASGEWETINGVFDATPEGNSATWEIEGEITY